MREEGELWSLNFEGRRFVCWKCGSPDHIGDKCRGHEKTFEEVFGDPQAETTPSWAAVVKGSSALDDQFRLKRDAMARQIQLSNVKKAQEKQLGGSNGNSALADVNRQLEIQARELVEVAAADASKKPFDDCSRLFISS